MIDTSNIPTLGSQSAFGSAPVDPSWTYALPQQVLDDTQLSPDEKRSILAGWASDALAVENHPALRRLPWSEQILSLDEILEALRSLDHQVGEFRHLTISASGAESGSRSISSVEGSTSGDAVKPIKMLTEKLLAD